MSETSTAATTKCSPQAGFGAIAGITVSSTEKFLQAFQASVTSASSSITEELLVSFLLGADSFASQCCDKFAAMLRQSSSQPEVRETTEPVLSRLVRNRCFESLDMVLVDYVSILRALHIDLKQKAGQLSSSRVRDAANESGAVQPTATKDGSKVMTLEGKATALAKIRDYLRAIENLPQELLDYGAIKLFGGDVDYVLEKRYLQNIKEGIHEKWSASVAAIEGFDALRQKLWEDRRASETAAITAAAMSAVQGNVQRKSAFGSLVIGLVCTAPVWFISTTGANSPLLIGTAVLLGIIAIVFLYLGIHRLTKA